MSIIIIMFLRVADFHRAFGQLIATQPQLPEQSIRNLRLSLINEELNEYCNAFRDNDIVEMADGLGDLLYVLAGTAVSYGVAQTTPYSSPFPQTDYADRLVVDQDSAVRLTDAFGYLLKTEADDDLSQIETAIYAMMEDVFVVADIYKLPINDIFAEIHRSNMSKLQADGTVLRRDDGKVLKPETYSPANIRSILYPHE